MIVNIWNVVQRTQGTYLSPKPLEEFVPSYVFQGLNTSEKNEVIRSRQRSEMTVEVLMEMVMAYWSSHAVVGLVPITSIVRHMQLLLRMVQKRPLHQVVRYSKLLPSHVSILVAKDQGSIAEYLVSEQMEVHKKAAEVAKSQSVAAKSKQRPEKDQKKGPSLGAVPIKDQVCLKHHPTKNKSCPTKDSGCPRIHLDTNIQSDLKKYEDAQKIVLGLKRQRPRVR